MLLLTPEFPVTARKSPLRPLGASILLLFLSGCNGAPEQVPETGGFISHVSGQSSRGGLEADSEGDGDAIVSAPPTDDGAESPERAIAEADIIQVDGNRLYALSQFSGMSIVDIGDPTNLRLEGSYRGSGVPFEMYLEGDVAYVMYNGWYSYVYDEEAGGYQWTTTSRMQALDVSRPANIQAIGDLEVPGQIADSRKVGDVIYLATHQSGNCWDCDEAASSRVTSFNVSDPSKFSPVDSAVFQTEDGWQRSISVTTDRIYISGWTWSGDQNEGGTIDVVDISDPTGKLKKGASVSVAGQIENRWQMDEFDGTLRVISQPGGWGTTTPPVVETFRVNSADDIQPLAALTMRLPRPEDLRSVRFDGTRAFAITFEQTDPLFTFDLSDPANPKQVGELEIPGWVYHMEPRGDRVYALGFDEGNAEGSLHVSLFDVSDLAHPIQLDRANFGGDWGGFAEDQDRIHKAFNILADEGLILVPFYGGGYDEASCSYDYQSGIQLIDMTKDSLEKRGVAPQVGSARRALLHEGALLGVGDNAVQSFDIGNRDKPVKLDQVDTARNVTNIRVMGDTMLRFGSDWWTDQTVLDFASLDRVESAEPLGELDLESVVEQVDAVCSSKDGEYRYESSNWSAQVFVHGSYAYVPRYRSLQEEKGKTWSSTTELTFYIVDISDRTNPELLGTFAVDGTNDAKNEYYAGIVQTDNALLVGRSSGYYYYDQGSGERAEVTFRYDVIDLSTPAAPQMVKRLEVPSSLASGGWGYGVEGCSIDSGWGWWGGFGAGNQNALVSGNIVASQHEEEVKDGTGRVRYFLDRIDVSDPKAPRLLPKINIPGTVVHFNADADRVVTIDYLLEEKAANGWEDCYSNNFYGTFDEEQKVCRTYRRRLNVLDLEGNTAILKDSQRIDRDARAGSIAVSDDRIFYNVTVWDDSDSAAPPKSTIHVLSYDKVGDIKAFDEVALENTAWWWGQLVARDGRAFMAGMNELTVVDARGDKVSLKQHDMGGWGCNELEVHDDVAYCAMGQYGVKSFPLD